MKTPSRNLWQKLNESLVWLMIPSKLMMTFAIFYGKPLEENLRYCMQKPKMEPKSFFQRLLNVFSISSIDKSHTNEIIRLVILFCSKKASLIMRTIQYLKNKNWKTFSTISKDRDVIFVRYPGIVDSNSNCTVTTSYTFPPKS